MNCNVATISMDMAKPIFGQPEGIVKGNPTTETRDIYTDKTEQFFSGIWSCTQGAWEFTNVGEEYCYLITGKVKLVAKNGTINIFSAGQAFVIPDGWQGTWECVEPITKHYVIMIPKSKL